MSTSYCFNCFWFNGAFEIHDLVRWCPPMSRKCSFKQDSSARLYLISIQELSCLSLWFTPTFCCPFIVVLVLFNVPEILFSWTCALIYPCSECSDIFVPFPLLLMHLYYIYVFRGLCFTIIISGGILIRAWEGRGEKQMLFGVNVRWEGFVVVSLDSTSYWGGQNCRSFYRVVLSQHVLTLYFISLLDC